MLTECTDKQMIMYLGVLATQQLEESLDNLGEPEDIEDEQQGRHCQNQALYISPQLCNLSLMIPHVLEEPQKQRDPGKQPADKQAHPICYVDVAFPQTLQPKVAYENHGQHLVD